MLNLQFAETMELTEAELEKVYGGNLFHYSLPQVKILVVVAVRLLGEVSVVPDIMGLIGLMG